jgi:hypothetical protein
MAGRGNRECIGTAERSKKFTTQLPTSIIRGGKGLRERRAYGTIAHENDVNQVEVIGIAFQLSDLILDLL